MRHRPRPDGHTEIAAGSYCLLIAIDEGRSKTYIEVDAAHFRVVLRTRNPEEPLRRDVKALQVAAYGGTTKDLDTTHVFGGSLDITTNSPEVGGPAPA